MKKRWSLVEEWTQAWKWISMQSMVAANAILLTWGQLPDDLRGMLPQDLGMHLASLILLLGTIGRILKKKAVEDDETVNRD